MEPDCSTRAGLPKFKQNADDARGSETLTRKMFLSESRLFRKIKAFTGQSVALHIRSVRLQHARVMLQNTGQTIAEIVYLTGFNDPSYFTRVFVKGFGVVLGEFEHV